MPRRGDLRQAPCTAGWIASAVGAALLVAAPPTAASAAVISSLRPSTAAHEMTAGRAVLGPAVPHVSVPATGRFHALPTTRIASTTTGLGLPRARIGAGRAVTIPLAGRAGLPGSGIRAVSLTVTALGPSGATQLWISAASTKPWLPTVTTNGARPGSSYAVSALSSTGRLQVWVGSYATDLTIDVSGWWGAASESGGGGLLKHAAGQQLAATSLAANATRSLPMLGRRGVPTKGVSALLLRVSANSSSVGQIGLAGWGSAAKATTALSYAAGVTDLVVVKPSAGAVAVFNRGRAPASVTVDVLGWFTDGTDRSAFGDTLRMIAPAQLFPGSRVGTSPSLRTVTGGAVPAPTSSTPPALVLVRELATAVTATGLLRTEPAAATPSGMAYLRNRAAVPTSRTVLVKPGANGQASWSTTAGTLVLRAERVAWFAGGTVISSRARQLTSATTAAITAMTDTETRFNGVPAQLIGVRVDDVLVAARTPTTPYGLMRRVTSVDDSSGNLVLGTVQAMLDEVITQGSLALSPNSPTPKAPAAPAMRPQLSGEGGCTPGGSLVGAELTVSCSFSADGPGYTATASLGLGAGADFAVDFTSGILPRPTVLAHASFNVAGSVSATQSATVSYSKSLEAPAGEATIPIGPIIIVLFPALTVSVGISGNVEQSLHAAGSRSGRIEVGYDAITGFVGNPPTITGSGSGGYDGEASLAISDTVSVGINIYVDAPPESPIRPAFGVAVTGSLTTTANFCTLQVTAGASVDLFVGVMSKIGADLTVSNSVAGANTELASLDLHNCALWSATFQYRAHLNWTSTDGTNSTDINSSAAMSLKPERHPPRYDEYELVGSGNGVRADRQTWNCGSPPVDVQAYWRYFWGGDIGADGGGPLKVAVTRAFGGGYVASMAAKAVTDGHNTADLWATDGNECQAIHDDGSQYSGWSENVFSLFTSDAVNGQVYFDIPAGGNQASGVEVLPGDDSSGETRYTLAWSFTKTCTMGGNNC